ncbi:PhnD/SsuA/transferrin family substrate-binding protein [Rhizobium sp. CNPSo 3464]|uniref:phosphate/phosphite/phosphonate ABC transporter substrate-binding protein n=1 Tax=Rhizobium sp. CNPSo 3464 TaxID=3021406 RepID=UPI0025506969|nr:PhnD/SsuA/transferrin family substrate-binding protein [Rhizobium sp. CNPSo 3464]MDK4740163.1 PhnD/SsuA/transferrin family substrate-binding protein [Rhizobium sp. CNPSo 3464]
MRLSNIAMYTGQPPLVAATDALWAYIGDRLRKAGVADVPETLEKGITHDEAWVQPGLLLAQTCGFPYVKYLRGRVQLVATPVYDLPGCDGPSMRSFIIVRKDSAIEALADLRGLTAAINDPGSNSGSNLFRAAIAPLAKGGSFFGRVIETGGHLRSIDAVTDGRADVAAIDCVTFGNANRFDPHRVAGVRILAETVSGPGLPFITGMETSAEELTLLRQILSGIASEPTLADVRDTLSLRCFEVLGDADYEALAELERQAITLGYPVIA